MANAIFQTLLQKLRVRAQRADAALATDVAALCRKFPGEVDAWLLLANVCQREGNAVGVLSALDHANTLAPQAVAIALELGVMQFRVGHSDAAASTLDRALSFHPRDVGLLFHRAYLLEMAGATESAEAFYRRALESDPLHSDSLANLGALLTRAGRHAEARSILEAAMRQRPQIALLDALIVSCTALDAMDAAMDYAEQALKANPHSAAAWLTAGATARKARDLPRAERYLKRATELANNGPAERSLKIESELAALLADAGEYTQSRVRFAQSMERSSRSLALHWMAAMALPSPSMSDAEATAAVANFDSDLTQLEDLVERADVAGLRETYDAATRFLPFPLAYLPVDSTDLMRRYGALLQKITVAAVPAFARPVDWRALEHAAKPRIGFVSANLRTHTITRYFRTWISGIDRDRFSTHAWHVNAQRDAETDAIAAEVDSFHGGLVEPMEVAESIRAARLDVLIFLDVGMDARVSVLANLRSAPLQCAAYGHPLTTGLQSIDVFLSGESLEREASQQQYVERLITLPGLGVQPSLPPAPNTRFAAPRSNGRSQLLCTQMLFKLQPEFDQLAARIIAASDAELFIFSGYRTASSLQQRVAQRIAGALRELGLDPARHLRLLPNCAYADYLGIVANCDMVLDTPWFTGGATSLDALHVGTPIATIDGTMLRGRQSAAMAGLIGVADLVATDVDDCVTRASAVLADRHRLANISERTKAAAPRLFDDNRSIIALNNLLQMLAEEARDRYV